MGETGRVGRRPNKIVTERTRELIMDSGRKEFLNVGYQKASLRAIARNAGQTTGAIYAHFRDKRDLFDALTRPVTDVLEAMFVEAQGEHFGLVETGEAHRSLELSTEKLRIFMGYIYDNLDSFRLLSAGAEGASVADFIRRLVDLNTAGTVEYLKAIRDAGGNPGAPDPEILHILTTCYFTAAFEPVVRGMTRGEAESYIETIARFFNAGWESLLDFGGPPTGPPAGPSGNESGPSGKASGAPGKPGGPSGEAGGVSGEAGGVSGEAGGASGEAGGASGEAGIASGNAKRDRGKRP